MRKIWTYLLLCVLLITSSLAQAQDEPYQEVFIIQQDERVTSVAWHPLENKLASASGSYIYIWDTQTGELLQSFEAYRGETTAIIWKPQGDKFASLGDDLEFNLYTAIIWDVNTQALLYSLDAVSVTSISWSPDGAYLATVNDLARNALEPVYVFSVWNSSQGMPMFVFQLSTGSPYRPYRNAPISAVWMSNEQFAGINMRGNISVWDIAIPGPITAFSESLGVPGNALDLSWNQAATWNSSRHLLAVSANDNYEQLYQVHVVNPSTQEYFPLELEVPGAIVSVLAWSPNGDRLACGNIDGVIQIWDADTFETLAILHQEDLESSAEWSYEDVVTSISWSPDGAYLASGSGAGVVRIWDVSP